MVLSQSNPEVDLAVAIAQLQSHKLQPLFHTLGWQTSNRAAITLQRLRCEPIAQKQATTVWQIVLPDKVQLTPYIERSLYREISALCLSLNAQIAPSASSPLVIFVDAKRTRSLWHFSPQESVLYATSQPTEIWGFRLKRLSQYQRGLHSFEQASDSKTTAIGYKTVQTLLATFADAIEGIAHPSDRDRYAALTFQRLVFIQVMQNKGWMSEDPWYLQSLFGRASQNKNSNFFSDWLQPLYRSLALPDIERPLALKEQFGHVPFIERVFDTHPLEEKYSAIALKNQPFEDILGWLSEQSNSETLNPFANSNLGNWLSQYWQNKSPSAHKKENKPTQASELVQARPEGLLCTFGLETLIKRKLLANNRFTRFSIEQFDSATLNNLLFNADATICRYLIQEVLPELRILDPACGSGVLLAEINRRLVDILSILTGYIQQTQDAQLKLWQSGLALESAANKYSSVSDSGSDEERSNTLLSLQKRVMRNNLYGVDIAIEAVETARFQIALAALVLAKYPDELMPLPDLSFNILVGNSLIGFTKVDEDRFEQVNQTGDRSILQGNLLQPLAAESYQTTLDEKNLALEHYKSRNEVLATARSIPSYARASLLREEIVQLDAKAQRKLNALLLNYMSQQLSIQYKAMQLADKPQKRLLTEDDIDVLQPFHWGYHFNRIIRQGGFDLVICQPPHEAFKPTVSEFMHHFQDLAATDKIAPDSFKTSKQALSKADPEVAHAWMFYQDTYAYAADYFYRSEQYAQQNPQVNGKVVRNQLKKERLFVERCFSLLKVDGISVIALRYKLSEEPRAQTLWQYLAEFSTCAERSSAQAAEQSIALESTEETILSCYKTAST